MKLPELEHSERYVGLYVVDFGETCGLGYMAEEVAMLLESEKYADAKVYRIYGARPDGSMELKGIPAGRFQIESGMFFHFRNLESARGEYENIRRLADKNLPCRTQLMLSAASVKASFPFIVGLAYPAECDEDVSLWMLDKNISAGEYADGGIGRLEEIRRNTKIIDSAQLHAATSSQARTRQEVFDSVDRPIQRIA